MIDPAQIPDEVVEAAKSTYSEVYWAGGATPKAFRAALQSAIAAALAAWPNKESLNKPGDWGRYIVLPIPQEARDD